MSSTEGAAHGAALLAGVGAGVFASVDQACDRTIRVTERVLPSADVAVYADFYPVYRALYPALVSQFKAVGAVSSRHFGDQAVL